MNRKLCTSPYHRGPRWILTLYFDVRKRNPDGSAKTFQSRCRTCMLIEHRIRLGIQRRGRPYEKRTGHRISGYKGETEEERQRRRAYKRAQYKKNMANPGKRKKRKERERMNATLRRRQEGIPPRQFKNHAFAVDKEEPERLPVTPIARWLRDNGITHLPHFDKPQIRRITEEARPTINLDTVDQILTQSGRPDLLNKLYPIDEPP